LGKSIINLGTIFGFLIISTLAVAKVSVDLGVSEFQKRDYLKRSIDVASIEGLVKEEYSPKYVQISAIKIKITESLSGHYRSGDKITCKIIDSLKMIAPFEEQILDKTLDLQQGEEILVYLGESKKGCEVAHLSKITNGIVHFPDYKKQSKVDIPMREAKANILSALMNK
jgi:hypothetical protein